MFLCKIVFVLSAASDIFYLNGNNAQYGNNAWVGSNLDPTTPLIIGGTTSNTTRTPARSMLLFNTITMTSEPGTSLIPGIPLTKPAQRRQGCTLVQGENTTDTPVSKPRGFWKTFIMSNKQKSNVAEQMRNYVPTTKGLKSNTTYYYQSQSRQQQGNTTNELTTEITSEKTTEITTEKTTELTTEKASEKTIEKTTELATVTVVKESTTDVTNTDFTTEAKSLSDPKHALREGWTTISLTQLSTTLYPFLSILHNQREQKKFPFFRMFLLQMSQLLGYGKPAEVNLEFWKTAEIVIVKRYIEKEGRLSDADNLARSIKTFMRRMCDGSGWPQKDMARRFIPKILNYNLLYPDVAAIFKELNDLYHIEDGNELFKTCEMFYFYPQNGVNMTYMIEAVTDAVMRPYYRLGNSTQRINLLWRIEQAAYAERGLEVFRRMETKKKFYKDMKVNNSRFVNLKNKMHLGRKPSLRYSVNPNQKQTKPTRNDDISSILERNIKKHGVGATPLKLEEIHKKHKQKDMKTTVDKLKYIREESRYSDEEIEVKSNLNRALGRDTTQNYNRINTKNNNNRHTNTRQNKYIKVHKQHSTKPNGFSLDKRIRKSRKKVKEKRRENIFVKHKRRKSSINNGQQFNLNNGLRRGFKIRSSQRHTTQSSTIQYKRQYNYETKNKNIEFFPRTPVGRTEKDILRYIKGESSYSDEEDDIKNKLHRELARGTFAPNFERITIEVDNRKNFDQKARFSRAFWRTLKVKPKDKTQQFHNSYTKITETQRVFDNDEDKPTDNDVLKYLRGEDSYTDDDEGNVLKNKLLYALGHATYVSSNVR